MAAALEPTPPRRATGTSVLHVCPPPPTAASTPSSSSLLSSEALTRPAAASSCASSCASMSLSICSTLRLVLRPLGLAGSGNAAGRRSPPDAREPTVRAADGGRCRRLLEPDTSSLSNVGTASAAEAAGVHGAGSGRIHLETEGRGGSSSAEDSLLEATGGGCTVAIRRGSDTVPERWCAESLPAAHEVTRLALSLIISRGKRLPRRVFMRGRSAFARASLLATMTRTDSWKDLLLRNVAALCFFTGDKARGSRAPW